MATLVLTAIGDDQSGLVDALSGVIADHGGNWQRSHMTQLAGKFAGIVEITVADDRADALVTDLGPLESKGLLEIIVERAMYWPSGDTIIGGHDSNGVLNPALEWNIAEGYTGDDFDTFILVQNTNDTEANVSIIYMMQGGGTLTSEITVPANSRYTIVTHDPDQVGIGFAFSTNLVSDQPIIVERAMYFPNGGHNTKGVAE